MDVHIAQNSVIARVAARMLKAERIAVTINNKIYLYNSSKEDFLKNKKWVCHEIAHIMQYKRSGSLNFILEYLSQCLIKGYTNNKFEKEAREKENDFTLIEGIKFV